MARLNVTHLKEKIKNRSSKRGGSKLRAFTAADARGEDDRRTRLAQRTFKKLPKRKRKTAKRLVKRLCYHNSPPPTASSAAYLFDLGERITDHLVRLTWKKSKNGVFTATLIPATSKQDSLDKQDAKKWMERLRRDLDRAGGRKANGWVFAGIHGEYDPDVDLLGIHYHLVIFGLEMKKVVEQLRHLPKYQSHDSSAGTRGARLRPIRIKRVNPDELRYALSYAAQFWWPSRRRGRDLRGKRFAGSRCRIAGVRHTDWLLWMDRQPPQNLYLLYNLSVGAKGLKPSKARQRCTSIGEREVDK